MRQKHSTADRLARSVHVVLLLGLIASAVLLGLGLVVTLWHNEPRPNLVHPQFAELIHAAIAGNGPALLYLGIVLLMLTPIARVFVLCTGWFVERQYRMALVALWVLILLAICMVAGSR